MNLLKHITNTDLHTPRHVDLRIIKRVLRDPRFWIITTLTALVLLVLAFAVAVPGRTPTELGGFPVSYPYVPVP